MTASHAGAATVQLVHRGSIGVVTATISSVGAALDSLVVDDVELIQQWNGSHERPYSSGLVLAPWPNRIRDGKWSTDGTHHQLAVTEPARGNAIHGLVTNTEFGIAEHTESSVTLTTTISPTLGYPFSLSLSVNYELTRSGISCSMNLSNIGDSTAPIALGAHPYLRVGDASVRSLTISAPVVSYLVTDDQMIPIDELPVADSPVDIRMPTPLSDLELDTGFRLSGNHVLTTTLSSTDGASVSLWQGAEFSWLQVFVTDEFPGPEGPTSAVAIEPMTAPADAFNSGIDLTWLSAGQQWSGSWGISLNH